MDGETVRRLREAKRLTLAQLAEKTGLSESYVWRIEKGQRTPSRKTERKLAKELDSDPEPSTLRDVGPTPSGMLDVEAAINNDPALTRKQKLVLLTLYEIFVNPG